MPEFMNTDGTFGDMAEAPEALKTMVESKGFKSVDDLVGMASNLEQMQGDWNNPLSMKLPDEFTAEDLGVINGKLGVPADVSGYTFEADEAVPMDDALMSGFKEFAKTSNFTPSQFSGLMDFYTSMVKTEAASFETQSAANLDSSIAALKDLWKGEGEYDKNVLLADNVVKNLGLSEEFAGLGLSSNPKLIAAMHKIGLATEEGVLPGKKPAVDEKTNAERIIEITKDPAFTNNMDPKHDELLKEWQTLHGIGV